mgnify:CR=1 FL=1
MLPISHSPPHSSIVVWDYNSEPSQILTFGPNSLANTSNIILGPNTVTSGTVENTIRTTNETTLFLAGQFSGSWGDLAGIGRFKIFPSEEMRNTLPVKSAGLISELPGREANVGFAEAVEHSAVFDPPPEEEEDS